MRKPQQNHILAARPEVVCAPGRIWRAWPEALAGSGGLIRALGAGAALGLLLRALAADPGLIRALGRPGDREGAAGDLGGLRPVGGLLRAGKRKAPAQGRGL